LVTVHDAFEVQCNETRAADGTRTEVPLLDVAQSLWRGDASPFEAVMETFVRGLERIARADDFEAVSFEAAVLGVTAWYRHVLDEGGDTLEAVDDMLDKMVTRASEQLRELSLGPPMLLKRLAGIDEAYYEYKACEYAVVHSGLERPHAVLAGGQGSVQMVAYDSMHALNEVGEKRGKALLANAPSKREGLRAWEAHLRAALAAAEASCAFYRLLRHNAAEGGTVNVVCISGFFYGACEARIAHRKQREYTYERLDVVLPKLAARIDEMMEDADAKFAPSSKKDPLWELPNLVRLHVLLTHVFGQHTDSVRCLFARDWVIKGTPYRTTWTAGFFGEAVLANRDAQPEGV